MRPQRLRQRSRPPIFKLLKSKSRARAHHWTPAAPPLTSNTGPHCVHRSLVPLTPRKQSSTKVPTPPKQHQP
jgi:hypothetical protein